MSDESAEVLSEVEREAMLFALAAPDPDRGPITEIQRMYVVAATERILTSRLAAERAARADAESQAARELAHCEALCIRVEQEITKRDDLRAKVAAVEALAEELFGGSNVGSSGRHLITEHDAERLRAALADALGEGDGISRFIGMDGMPAAVRAEKRAQEWLRARADALTDTAGVRDG